MGWTSVFLDRGFSKTISSKKKKEFLDGEFSIGDDKILKSSMVGNTYYAALETTRRDTNERFVFALVVMTSVSGSEFSFKEMDESMMPYQFECPVGILNLLSETDSEHANDWRNRCHELRKNKTLLDKGKLDDQIKIKDSSGKDRLLTYTLTSTNGTKKWVDKQTNTYFNKSFILEREIEFLYKNEE